MRKIDGENEPKVDKHADFKEIYEVTPLIKRDYSWLRQESLGRVGKEF